MKPYRILFVCTGNICRSATAELMMRRRLTELGWSRVEVSSAGVWAEEGDSCPPETLAALDRKGLDGRGHRARPLTAALAAWADMILAMTEEHRTTVSARHPRADGKARLFKPYVGLSGDVADPYGGGDEDHDACTAEIAGAVEKLLEILKKEASR